MFDPILGRMTILSPEYDFVATVPLGFAAGRGLFLGSRMVLNAGIRTSQRVGYPLHLVERDGNVVRSFGADGGAPFRPDLRDIIEFRAVARAGEDAVWAGWMNQYVIERWDTQGTLTQVLRRDVPWFPAWWETTADPEAPPPRHIRGLQQRGDTMWVFVIVPGEEWRSTVRQDGQRRIVDDYDIYQDTMIEAIDLRSGDILASSRLPSPLGDGFVGPGLVYSRGSDTFGNPVVSIWELHIVDPSQGGKFHER